MTDYKRYSMATIMEFLAKRPFSIITEHDIDYSGGVKLDVRTIFPNKTYLTDAIDNIHQKYPQYSTLAEALKYAKRLLLEEKTVIAVVVEEIKDHFKLHVKTSNKYEHMDVAYSRVAHGMKRKHSSILVRKVASTYKTTEDMVEHTSSMIGDLINGYINVSLVLNIILGGSFMFNMIVLGMYHAYFKSFTVNYYHQLIIIIKNRWASLPYHAHPEKTDSPPITQTTAVVSDSSEDDTSSDTHSDGTGDEDAHIPSDEERRINTDALTPTEVRDAMLSHFNTSTGSIASRTRTASNPPVPKRRDL